MSTEVQGKGLKRILLDVVFEKEDFFFEFFLNFVFQKWDVGYLEKLELEINFWIPSEIDSRTSSLEHFRRPTFSISFIWTWFEYNSNKFWDSFWAQKLINHQQFWTREVNKFCSIESKLFLIQDALWEDCKINSKRAGISSLELTEGTVLGLNIESNIQNGIK